MISHIQIAGLAGPRVWYSRPRRAVALLLALIVVTVAGIVVYSYLGAQATSVGIARNIRDGAQARCVAETGLDLAIAYVKAHDNWRTERASGTWVNNQSFGPGSFTITGVDPVDGNLANNTTDPLAISAIGKVGNATRVAKAALVPRAARVGNTTAFPNSADHVQGQQIATQITLGKSTSLTAISLYGNGPPPKQIRLAVYSDSGGEPAALLAQTSVAAISSNNALWYTLTLSSPLRVEAGTCWLAFSFEHPNESYYYLATGGQTRIKNNDAISHGFTPTWGTSSSSNGWRISICAATTDTTYEIDRRD